MANTEREYLKKIRTDHGFSVFKTEQLISEQVSGNVKYSISTYSRLESGASIHTSTLIGIFLVLSKNFHVDLRELVLLETDYQLALISEVSDDGRKRQPSKSTFGTELKAVLAEKKYTQTQLAKDLKLESPTYLYNIANGIAYPNEQIIADISRILDLPDNYFSDDWKFLKKRRSDG